MQIKNKLRFLNGEAEVIASVLKDVHQFTKFSEVKRRTLFQFQLFKNTCACTFAHAQCTYVHLVSPTHTFTFPALSNKP